MAILKKKKEAILTNLKQSVASQKSVVILSTTDAEHSLDSKANFGIRSSARKEGVGMQLVKNTLIEKSFESISNLVGQTYIAYMDKPELSDEIKVPKVIVSLVTKDFKENFKILGTVVNGQFFDAKKTLELSKTPNFKDSMGMIASSLNQITAKIAISINEIPSSVARAVSEASKIKS